MDRNEKEYFESMDAPDNWVSWMRTKHKEFADGGKNYFQKKIADFFDANKIDYLFKCPVCIPKDEKVFFVDFYLPDYTFMVDIEAKKEYQYYDEKKEELRTLLLSSIKGMGYHIIKRWDLKSDDFRCKISGALLARWEMKRGEIQKHNMRAMNSSSRIQ